MSGLKTSCHTAWHRLIVLQDGVLKNFLLNCLQLLDLLTNYRDHWNCCLKASQMCAIGERSGNHAGQRSIGEAWRQIIATCAFSFWALSYVKLSPGTWKWTVTKPLVECYHWAVSVPDMTSKGGLTIKVDGTEEHNALLWASAACDSHTHCLGCLRKCFQCLQDTVGKETRH